MWRGRGGGRERLAGASNSQSGTGTRTRCFGSRSVWRTGRTVFTPVRDIGLWLKRRTEPPRTPMDPAGWRRHPRHLWAAPRSTLQLGAAGAHKGEGEVQKWRSVSDNKASRAPPNDPILPAAQPLELYRCRRRGMHGAPGGASVHEMWSRLLDTSQRPGSCWGGAARASGCASGCGRGRH